MHRYNARTLTSLKKLDDRGKKYIFVGYTPNGYRLYDKERRKIKFSRDVTFAEENKLDNETVKLKTNIEEEEQNEGETENNLEIIYESEEDSTGQYQDAIGESQSEEEEIQEEQETQEELGRGKRIKKIPSELKDYVFLTYEEAITGSDKEKWKKAIEEERKSLEENNT